ncbi:ABC transporter permease [Defluviitalea phaphyphila]|uniref:ABC transporter permease n=1 Tax=Defluviitalea phaphyphila TaxID=1473580 RepID=UPI000731C0FD|nr:ABC transporter permease subunit [Defluviitalea phaphyphila]
MVIKKFLKSKYMVNIVWILLFFIGWEIVALLVELSPEIRSPEKVLPHFWKIIASVFDVNKIDGENTAIQLVLMNAKATLIRSVEGFILGMIWGFILALLMNLSGIIEKIAFPYLMLIQMIPILGMAPIILAITGDINKSRIWIAAILTFYPVATNTLAGFKSVEKEKHELMYSYAATTFQIYTKTLIPAAIPYFFTGLKIAAPLAITASIIVDTLQGDLGLGCLLSQSLKGSMTRYVFWQIVVISAAIGILSYVLMGIIEKIISPHNRLKKN